ncbi:hypothetical protein LCGC14_0878860 [marine sediment metagenome]|uniref:Uncharacterized protein n=1 Tax=marine sediment metagenome TaxID=412755 RepID=A0A0F9RM12_9ZZZZ
MAENDRCIKRNVAVDIEFDIVYVDHHEWRFLRQATTYNEVGTEVMHSLYYCIFCLKLAEREIKVQ